jgi:hypothetical protein
MRQGIVPSLGLALAVCFLLTCDVRAQETPDKLVVQVVYSRGAKPAYLEVPGCAWYGAFGSTPAANARAAADTVQAVDVKTNVKDGRVELKVGVHVGERFFDSFDEVATYTASVGETFEAFDLARFGVQPFVFKVLRVGANETAAPAVVNNTQSVGAAVTDFTPAPLPRAKLTLTNLSQKRVRAVMLQTVFGGRRRTSSMAMQSEGKVLLEPGGTYERKIGITDGRPSETDFAPQSIDGVVVAAVVFEDYTYEGDAEPASMKVSMDEGERLQLPRLLRLIADARAEAGSNAAGAAGRLKAALEALDDAAPQTSVDALRAAYPQAASLTERNARDGVEVSMHHVRTEMLKDLERFEKQSESAPAGNGFKRWLEEQEARYKAWLARL